MPERNLVRAVHSNRCLVMLMVALTFASMQLGCSKLGQMTFNRDLLSGKSNQPRWSSEAPDSVSRYVSDPDRDLDSVEQKDEARIVGIGDREASDIDVKLVASQPAPRIDQAKSDSPNSANNLLCEHAGDCDCQKPKIKPMLPYAEPVEPPPITSQAPPTGLVNQPLTPLLVDTPTRAIQMTEVEPSDNSLRRNEKWSYEKAAALSSKPIAIELATSDSDLARSNSVRFNPSQDQIAKPILANDLSRATSNIEDAQSAVANVEARPLAVCVDCHETGCDGSCNSSTGRPDARGLRPIVESDPVVIVATTSSDTIPPFAEGPSDNEPTGVASEPTREMPESAPIAESTSAETQAESLDDLGEEDWSAMFGPKSENGAGCPACESSQCQDPNCKTSERELANETVAAPDSNRVIDMLDESGSLASANKSLRQEASLAQATTIPSTVTPDSDNDFRPVSHTAPVGNFELEIELPAWFQPKTETPEEVPPTTESSALPVQPAKDPKTAELPLPELDPVSVSNASKSLPRERQPQIYSSLPVRFEIIDNTVPWTEKLTETIQNVRSQLAIEPEPAARNGLEVNLRFLEVLQRQMVDVEVRKDSLSNVEKQFWQHQLDAITLMLQSNDSGDSDQARHKTVINTLDHLRKAVERLESIAELQITNGVFCTEVSGFGQFKAFPSTSFGPGQQLLVYCEVENYSSIQRQVELDTQVLTRLRGSYVIYNEQGRAVQQAEYAVVEDVARKRRRDFYLHFPIQLANLPPGQYKLELMVEDLNGNQTASIKPGLEFQVN